MDIYVGSDHAGYNLKQAVKKHLEENGYKVIDLGSYSPDDPVDYSDIAREVAEKIQENQDAMGVMICGTGQGSAMALNRHKTVRAALCTNIELAEMSRRHNYANVLCLGERTTEEKLALEILDKFLNTQPDPDERHKRRIEKFDV